MMMYQIPIVFTLMLALIAPCLAASLGPRSGIQEHSNFHPKAAHEVQQLPGYRDSFLSRHYSGYITVDESSRRQLWYWLASSEGSPRRDPLVLWLTGGPGCSSLDAFIYENGPFKLHFEESEVGEEAGAKSGHGRRRVVVTDNPHSWSKAATMVYVDSPAGTGMSFSHDTGDYRTNDTQTVEDLVSFVQQLLDTFPEYAENDFYIAGESYAGVYIPLLAKALLKANKRGRGARVNIKGYMIGNGVTDDEYDGNAGVEFAYGHGLIDVSQYRELQGECGGHYWNASEGSRCKQLLRSMEDRWGYLNIYDIGNPCILNGGNSGAGGSEGAGLLSQPSELSQLRSAGVRAWPLSAAVPHPPEAVKNWGHLLKHVIPCADRRHALQWLNDDEVREAIHAAPTWQLPQWSPCSDVLHYQHDTGSMIPIHQHNLRHGLRVLVYSGDMDYVVPFTGSRAWVDSLQLDAEREWTPWTIHKQVAGFSVRYTNGLTLATVKGAGHMVPQCQPETALHLFRRYLDDDL